MHELTQDTVIKVRGECPVGIPIMRAPLMGVDPLDMNVAAARLYAVLSWKRPFESKTEELFAQHYLDVIPGMETDGFRNRHLHIPYPNGDRCKIMWSCHIDTCHHDEGYQRLTILKDVEGFQYLQVMRGEGSCLGADDGTGVFILLEMIRAKKPGYYIFHRGEEKGCQGSRWLKDNKPDLLKTFDAAIALDRKDFDNIITHQSGERCCSEGFALAIGKQLAKYKPDPTGAVTDTRQYTGLISECTNLSVGYQSQHGPLERQYIGFAVALSKALVAMDLKSLPILRDPTKVEYKSNSYGGTYRYDAIKRPCEDPLHPMHRAFGSGITDGTWVYSMRESRNIIREKAVWVAGKGYITRKDDDPEPGERDANEILMEEDSKKMLLELVKENPNIAYRLLVSAKCNTFDFLCAKYGEEEYLNFAMEVLDLEDKAADEKATIVDSEDP